MPDKDIKAVIFDLDGTLTDTEKYYQIAWPKAFAHFGYEAPKDFALELRSLGRPFAPKRFKEVFGEDFDYAKGIFDSVGKTRILPERLFDGVVAVSGSSPAYVYMMIEAMADAAVKEGLPRVYAYEMAAQSVLGSALMVLSSGTHPAALKDAVCSPGGTTIEAVKELERKGFRAAIMDAMEACARKSREMSEK
jgi:pyrroline-5-carboxylate reductase